MDNCVNINDPAFKELLTVFDEATARTIVIQNNNVIPSIDEATKILSELRTEERDEQFVRSSEEFKLRRTKEQNNTLTNMKVFANEAQKEALNKLINNNIKYQEFLQKNIDLVDIGKNPIPSYSVTTFIGSSEFSGDQSKYEAFKHFGTFMHDILEKSQVKALGTNTSITQQLTQEFFDETYGKYLKKNPFYIEDLTKELMFDMAMRIAEHVAMNKDEGYLILPEVTVCAEDRTGNLVVGRLDLLLIGHDGKTKIFDFKTKKVTNMVYKSAFGNYEQDLGRAFVNLAATQYKVTPKEGMAGKLKASNLARTAYDNWTLQLQTYENMLGKAGLVTEESKIIALLYQADRDDKKIIGNALHIFKGENYFEYAANADVFGDDGFWKKDPLYTALRINQYRNAVDYDLPIGDPLIEEQMKKQFQPLEFVPTKEENDKLLETVKQTIKNEIEGIKNRISELSFQKKSTTQLYELLKTRKTTLDALQVFIDNASDTEKKYQFNFYNTLIKTETDLNKMSELSSTAMTAFRNSNLEFFSDNVVQLREAFQKANGLSGIVDILESIVNEARQNPENNITVDSEIMKKLGEMRQHIVNVEANFRESFATVGAKMMMTPGETVFKTLNAQTKLALEPKIAKLEDEISKLRNGEAANAFQAIKGVTMAFLSETFKNNLANKVGFDGKNVISKIEKLEIELLRLKAYSETGFEYSEEAMKKYIRSVTDPNSHVYIGAQDIYNSTSLFTGLLLDKGISSASNGDLAISAYTQMLKNGQYKAIENIQNDLVAIQFDKDRDRLLKRFTVDQLNDEMAEWRTYKVVNEKTGEIEVRRSLNFVKPYSQEYEDQYKEYSATLKDYNQKIRASEATANSKFGKPDYEQAKQELFDLKKEKDNYNTERIKWLIENTSLPFNESFYKLQTLMPAEIRDELQEKYFEIQQITYQVGDGNEVLLEDYDFDRLKELEDDIRVLRQKAKNLNPEYAAYMEEFNNLFEFDTNYAFYQRRETNAKSKFSEHPELLEKWYNDNTVTKPKSEWYDKLSEVYEERAALFGTDPVVSELIEKRSVILRPHKVGGILQTQHISDEEVEELSMIEDELEEIFKQKQDEPGVLTPEERDAAKAIKLKLDKLVSSQLSKSYMNDRDAKIKALQNDKKNLIKAELELEKAKKSGEQEAIDKATEDVIFYEGAFATQEQIFEQWYNKYHTNVYKSILNTEEDIIKRTVPKSFNYQKLPAPSAAAEYMETVPHPKYKIKKLKESSYNPDFLQAPDGIPMPKGVYKDVDGSYKVDRNIDKIQNINSKYLKLSEDKELYDFYNKLTKMFFNLQIKTEGRKIGYKVPGFASTLMQNFSRDGVVKGVKDRWEQYIDKSWRAHGAQDDVTNEFGDSGNRIRLRFNDQLPENMQSKDAIGCLIKWTTEAHYNIAMQEVAPLADTFIAGIELMSEDLKRMVQSTPVVKDAEGKPVDMNKRLNEIENVLSILKVERRKFINAQDQSLTYLNRGMTKVVNNIMSYTSFIRIGFDAVNQTKNYVSGNVQAFVAAGGMEGDHYSKADYMWAKGQVYGLGEDGFLKNYWKDWGNISDISKSTMLYRLYNPMQKDFLKYVNEITGTHKRKMLAKAMDVRELGYLLQDKGDTEIGVTVMYSVLNHYKFNVIESVDPVTGQNIYKKDAQGNNVMVPAHEVYIKDKDGILTRRNDVEFSEKDEQRLRNTIFSEMRRAQGNYAKADETAFEENVVGKLVFFFRKFVIPSFLNRFGYIRPNWESGEVAAGYWRAFTIAFRHYGPKETMKQLVLGRSGIQRMGLQTTVNDFYARKIKHAQRDAMIMALMTILALMARNYVRKKDDEDEDLSMLEGNAIRLIWSVQQETNSMFPVGAGSKEYVKNFTTFTAYTREFNALIATTGHAINTVGSLIVNNGEEPDDQSSYAYSLWKNSHYLRESGGYQKGDPKLLKDFVDLTGVKNIKNILDPNAGIDIMKRNQ